MPSFPTTVEQLTSKWLSEKLGCTVDSFTAAPLGEGFGMLSVLTRLTCKGDGCPETIIAKFPSLFEDNRAVANTYDMYAREYRYYTQVAPHVPLKTPICYHAEYDEKTHDFVLLIEDLGGLRIGDQTAGCTQAEAHQVIEAIAALHRNTWQPDHITDIKRHDMPYQRDGMVAGFTAGWPAVQRDFPHHFDAEVIEHGKTFADKINRLLDEIHDGPLVIAQGDVRLDNIFFTGDHVAMVDFQAVCKAAPEHDLAYFVTQSLAEDVRRAEDWHQVYFDLLTQDGIEYSKELSYRRFLLCALYFLCYAVIIGGTLDQGNERGRKLADTLLRNSLGSLRELNAFELIRE